MKKIVSIVLMLLIAFSLVSCLETTPDEDPPKGTPTVEYKLNEAATANSIQITAIELKTSVGDQSASIVLNPIVEGKVYIGVKFSITNNSAENFTLSSILCFTAKHKNEKMTYKLYAPVLFDGKSVDGTIKPNDTLVGWYCFAAPSDWTDVKILFEESLGTDEIITFALSATI